MEYMRAKGANQVKAPTTVVVALAFVAVVLYSLWGGAFLRSEQARANTQPPVATVGH